MTYIISLSDWTWFILICLYIYLYQTYNGLVYCEVESYREANILSTFWTLWLWYNACTTYIKVHIWFVVIGDILTHFFLYLTVLLHFLQHCHYFILFSRFNFEYAYILILPRTQTIFQWNSVFYNIRNIGCE